MSAVRLLIAGDLHLGRASSRVPTGAGTDITARGAWDRIVEAAIREGVQLLCLTGDVADQRNRFWEALGPLEQGIRRLAERGIRTLAVSGNHDHDVLVRLADQLDPDAFRLLGRGGTWQRYTHEIDGAPVLHVDGWSFPRERVHTSPLESYQRRPDASTPTVAMVHGDLDVPESRYAPLSRQALSAQPVLGWLLGHIHAPLRAVEAGRPFLVYPGSPQALDPGETGVHGIVLAELEHGRFLPLRPLPISTVRYESVRVDLGGVDDDAEFTRRVRTALDAAVATADREGGGLLRHLSLRVNLTGRTLLAGALRTDAPRFAEDYDTEIGGIRVSIDRVGLDVLPPIDLEDQARATTPPGMLARLLLDLERHESATELDEATRRLLRTARDRIVAQRHSNTFAGVRDEQHEPTEREVRQAVREQAELLLTRLLEPSA